MEEMSTTKRRGLLEEAMELSKKSPEEIEEVMIEKLGKEVGDDAKTVWETMKPQVLANLEELKKIEGIINSPKKDQEKKWLGVFREHYGDNAYQEMRKIRESALINDFRTHVGGNVVVYDTSIYENEEDRIILLDLIKERENPAIAIDLMIARRSRQAFLDGKITEKEEQRLQKLADKELRNDTLHLSRKEYLRIRKIKREMLESGEYDLKLGRVKKIAREEEDSLLVRIQHFKRYIKDRFQCSFEYLNNFPGLYKQKKEKTYCLICKNEMWQKAKLRRKKITCNAFCRNFYRSLTIKEQEYLKSIT